MQIHLIMQYVANRRDIFVSFNDMVIIKVKVKFPWSNGSIKMRMVTSLYLTKKKKKKQDDVCLSGSNATSKISTESIIGTYTMSFHCPSHKTFANLNFVSLPFTSF